jgi:hypothetical protein
MNLGTEQVVDANEEYIMVLRNLRDKYRPYRTMSLSPGTNPIVRINPEQVNVWGERFRYSRAANQ